MEYKTFNICRYSKLRFTAPRFTAANFFPQIGLNMHVVNKQTPIYRKPRSTADVSFSLKPAVNRGFTVI